MIVLAGADLVLPDRVLPSASLLIDDGRIAAIEPRLIDGPEGATRVDLAGHIVTPGLVDVHVHGLAGIDVLDGPSAVAAIARRLPRYGVTTFCPTSVACDPATLVMLLAAVDAARRDPDPRAARVAGAHLESNFINPDWNGAQPRGCIRRAAPGPAGAHEEGAFTGADILGAIAARRDQVKIVTLAPEQPGGLDLVRNLSAAGHRVSIGHTGAGYDMACAAVDAGARHATHLFNRMSPMSAREPGTVGAVLERDEVTAEIICDAFHVHPSMVRFAVGRKTPRAAIAITDGTAGAGLPPGSRARLGGRPILVTERSAILEDGTLAGSILTMDRALGVLVDRVGLGLVDAVRMCATTPAAALGLSGVGSLATGHVADLAVFGPGRAIRQVYVSGRPVLEH